MKMLSFAKRNTKEILRDPLTLLFGLGFPVVLLLLLSAIQASIPVPLFEPAELTPGITVFGLSFMTLFSAMLISKDRKSALMARLYTTPMRAVDFILGYTLPLLPVSILQCCICYLVAWPLGLAPTVHHLSVLLGVLPIALLYIALGLLLGSILNDKQVGGVCGALLTNLSAWLSDTWFDIDLVGGAFAYVARLLPFFHAVALERALLAGNYAQSLPHLAVTLGYALVLALFAVLVFLRQMKKQ